METYAGTACFPARTSPPAGAKLIIKYFSDPCDRTDAVETAVTGSWGNSGLCDQNILQISSRTAPRPSELPDFLINAAFTQTFCDTVGGAFASSVVYSLVETAKANNLDPYQYLLLLLTELPQIDSPLSAETLEPFFPWNATAACANLKYPF